MNHLVPCPECSRHVRVTEAACPFCAVSLDLAGTPPPQLPRARLGRAATFAFGATLASVTAVAACGGEATESSSGGAGNASHAGASSGGGAAGTAGSAAGGTAGANAGADNRGGTSTVAPPYGIPPMGGYGNGVPLYGTPPFPEEDAGQGGTPK